MSLRVRQLLREVSDEWRISTGTVSVLAVLPFLIAGGTVLAGAIDKELFRLLVAEDAFFESLQVLCLAICAAVSAILALRLKRGDRLAPSVVYVMLFLGFVFLLGEEISWGQRIVGWQTPEAWEEANRQGETNVHNLFALRELFQLGQLAVGVYGTLLPVYVFRRFSRDEFRRRFSFFVPHFGLVPYFLVVMVWRLYRTLSEPPEEWYFAISEFNEAVELVLYLAAVFFLLYHLRRRTYAGAAGESPPRSE